MAVIPADSRAFRREVFGGLVAFIVGFIGTAIAAVYVLVVYVVPESGWWASLASLIASVTLLPLFGACALTWMVVTPLSRWHHFRGFYRCPFCDRALRRNSIPCVCRWHDPDVREYIRALGRRKRRPRWRHERRHIGRVALILGLLAVPCIAAAAWRRDTAPNPMWADGGTFHVLLTGALAILLSVAGDALKWTGRGKRLRPRCTLLGQMLGFWLIGVLGILLAAVGVVEWWR